MENTNNLIVTSSPHIRSPRTTRSIMLDVCIALIPAGVAAVILFGWHALALIVASVIASVASEAVCQRLNPQARYYKRLFSNSHRTSGCIQRARQCAAVAAYDRLRHLR